MPAPDRPSGGSTPRSGRALLVLLMAASFLAIVWVVRGMSAASEADGMAALTIPAARGSIAIVAGSLEQALAMERSLRAT